jgi:uncharacterized protein YmfQ (DUF2313 family)
MSQRHEDILRQLFPLKILEGAFDADIAVEGAALDRAYDRAMDLLRQIFPQFADELIPRWEKLLHLNPGIEDPLQMRRDRVISKIREKGGLSVPYFIALAAGRGYDIDIEECIDGNPFLWSIICSTLDSYAFRAGESCAGDYLQWWENDSDFETWLNDLKPAHTRIVYNYASYVTTEEGEIIKGDDDIKILLEEQD